MGQFSVEKPVTPGSTLSGNQQPGIIRAIEECFPRSARQRCLAHRMRNLAAKVSADPWPEFKARVTACYQAPSRAIARQLAAGIRADYANALPSALACLEDDFEACIAHLRLPVTHRRFARTTNLLERLFVEERRRLKIIPQWLRREAGAQAHVRRAHPSRGALARPTLQRVRAPPDRRRPKGTRRRISGFNHAAGNVSPAQSFQQIQALTCPLAIVWFGPLFEGLGAGTVTFNMELDDRHGCSARAA